MTKKKVVFDMPTYEYICENCKNSTEEFRTFAQGHLEKCPTCKKNKLIQVFSGGIISYVKGGETLGQISDQNFKREGGKIKEKIAKEKEEADNKLPWWRSGKIKGLEKQDKILNVDKIKNVRKYIDKGEKK